MPMMDWLSTSGEIHWIIRDVETGKENMDIDWRVRRGSIARVRLVNDRHTLHAMQHPIHLHGQRFLVLPQNEVPTENLVWKDTALVPAGGTLDLLVEFSNPGSWMIHCHIAEHLEAGMHAMVRVE
jgi:suppressor of ftsI